MKCAMVSLGASRWLGCLALAGLLVGCGSLTDVRNANRLLKADHELAQLVATKESKPVTRLAGTVDLSVRNQLLLVGDDALRQATRLEEEGGVARRLEAVSWYRIAATAYWQSGEESVTDEMFQAAQRGRTLCASLGERAPDRDAFFLKLVIPFAAFEASAESSDQGLSQDLSDVDFGDDLETVEEIRILTDAYDWLNTMRVVLQQIGEPENDPVLTRHPSLKAYFDDNHAAAQEFYENVRAKLWSRLALLRERLPSAYDELEFTVDDTSALKF